MEDKVTYTDWKLKAKLKAAEVKAAAKEKFNEAKAWAKQNPELATTLAVTTLGLGSKAVKNAAKNKRLKEEEVLKTLYLWDNRAGCYWTLRRPMSNNERLIYEARRTNGEPVGEILMSMRLLK